MNSFFSQLAQLLEVPAHQLTPQTNLRQFELWDSLTIVSTLAIVDQCFGATISGIEVSECETIQDILSLAQQAVR